MGNGVSSIGDLFFPDNPNRRRRAEELRNQINAYGEEFKQLARFREQKLSVIRDKLDALMASKGFTTTSQLEEHVRSTLDSSQLASYDNLKNMLDLNDKVQGIIWDLVSIVGAASGIILGAAAIVGIVTGGAALAALGVVGEILAVVAVIVIVFGVIEGAIERDKLRDAINQLWLQRAKTKQALEQMRVVVNWVDALDVWLNNPATDNPTTLDALLNGTFEPEYRSWTMDRVFDVLGEMDRRNGSWTDEDPGRPMAFVAMTITPETGMKEAAELEAPPVADVSISENGGTPETSKFIYKALLSKESCIVERDGQMWKMTAIEWDKNVQLATTRFTIEPTEVKLLETNDFHDTPANINPYD
ncbi:hypothetical protein DL766_007901 [Monosporascus sp. MC13-8B]|nr:hypothetical protein DL766_007901 [Monosporascus sp. MC13-8B]